MGTQDAKSHLEQMDELREGTYVKWCCARIEAMGYPAPCGYCGMHCIQFYFGTLYIGCETIDNSLCLWWDKARDWGARGAPRSGDARVFGE